MTDLQNNQRANEHSRELNYRSDEQNTAENKGLRSKIADGLNRFIFSTVYFLKKVEVPFLVYLFIGLFIHIELTNSKFVLVNKLHESIFLTDQDQIFEIGNNSREILMHLFFNINWPIFLALQSIIFILCIIFKDLLCALPEIFLNYRISMIYILVLCINYKYSWPIIVNFIGLSIVAVIFSGIKYERSALENTFIQQFKTCIFFKRFYFLKVLLPTYLFFYIPFQFVIFRLLGSFFIGSLLNNEQKNVVFIPVLYLFYFEFKLITNYIKLFCIYLEHSVSERSYDNLNISMKNIKIALWESIKNNYCFLVFLLVVKIILDMILRTFLCYTKFYYKTFLIIICTICFFCQFFISLHKAILQCITAIWDRNPNIFTFHNISSNRRFYTGRNVFFYFKTVFHDLFTTTIWNVDQKIVLFFCLWAHFLFMFLQKSTFFDNIIDIQDRKEHNFGRIVKKIMSCLIWVDTKYKIPDSFLDSPIIIQNRRFCLGIFAFTPLFMFLIVSQAGLVSSIIYRKWYEERIQPI